MTIAFRMLLRTREKLYESGIFQSKRLSHPVISVGNLTLGGTGKTPLVIALSEGLRNSGYRPVILSRGYRRTSSGVVIVSRGDGPLVNADVAGDEPYLIAKRASVSVVVASDRHMAGLTAEREQLGNLFILDDGFQHRRLHRDFDIVAIDPLEWAAGEQLLPTGRWREPQSALSRAQAACVQEMPEVGQPPLSIPSFIVQTVVDGVYNGKIPLGIGELQKTGVVAFAGIAKPDRFFATVESLGIPIKSRIRFRDHHRYTADDLKQFNGDALLTTEKDAVRLESIGAGGFLHLRISAKIPEFDGLLALITRRLAGQM